MPDLPLLMPMRRELSLADGAYLLKGHRLIVLNSPVPQSLFVTARRSQPVLCGAVGLAWGIAASSAVPRRLERMRQDYQGD